MPNPLKIRFTKSRSNDKKSAAFIITNKPGIKKQYNKYHKVNESSSALITNTSSKQQRSIKSHGKSSKLQTQNKFKFNFSHLGRLSLSDDEYQHTTISSTVINEDKPAYNSKLFPSQMVNSQIKKVNKSVSKPIQTIERINSFIPAVDRKSSVNTMELLNKTHKLTVKNAHERKLKTKTTTVNQPKPNWKSLNTIIPKCQNNQIATKITEKPVMISGIKKEKSVYEIRKRKNKDITPKIGVNISLVQDAGNRVSKEDVSNANDVNEVTEINHSYPKSDLFERKTSPVNKNECDSDEPKPNHAYPRSDLFEVKGINNNNNNVKHALSWAIPMGDQKKSKKPPKVPARFKKKNGQKKPIWR